MTPEQIKLVKDSFAKLAPTMPAVTARFYQKLFEIEPSVRPLFADDLKAQGIKLTVALTTVVHSLDKLGDILDAVQAMGRRHVKYGVQDRHYASVGQALLETLQEGFGPAFDMPMREAWTAAYGKLAGAMIAAAHEESTKVG